MNHEIAAALRVGDFKDTVGRLNLSGVSHLATAFAVERSPVQNDPEHIPFGAVANGTDQAIVLWLADDDTFDLRGVLGVHVPEEIGVVQCFLKSLDGACFEELDSTTAADVTVARHRLTVSIPIKSEVLLSGDLLEQFGWDPVGLVQARGFVPIDHQLAAARHVGENAIDPIETRVDRREEIRLLALHDLRNTLDGF